MLFKMHDDDVLEPLPFVDFGDEKKLEKDLENLLASNLVGVLFEHAPLLPIHQERPRQGEADIYALNADGDLVVFELKRATAGAGSLDQLFRYVTKAGDWNYTEMDRKFRAYNERYGPSELAGLPLAEAHQEALRLSDPLEAGQFNQKQYMWVIGSAADTELIRAIEFWRSKGLPIDFFPYRVYRIGEERYFEFFAKPHDVHVNPAKTKGVLFDTNRSWNEDSCRQMLTQRRVSAYGSRKDAVYSLSRGDLVFYSHVGVGLVGAAKVVGRQVKADPANEELYWDVELLTPCPTDFENPTAMSFREVQKITGKSFFWARIQKVPFLTYEEAQHLLEELKNVLAE